MFQNKLENRSNGCNENVIQLYNIVCKRTTNQLLKYWERNVVTFHCPVFIYHILHFKMEYFSLDCSQVSSATELLMQIPAAVNAQNLKSVATNWI